MKLYEEPKLEVQAFFVEDVITDSGNDNGINTPEIPVT